MATSQIVPFATAPGANVQALADFLAAASTSAGFSSGVANSGALNRAWRQSSFMAAGLAGLLVSNGVDVVDDGNLASLVSKLVSLFAGTSSTQKLPGGFILQWGIGPASDSAGRSIATFPAAFPTNCLLLLGSYSSRATAAGEQVVVTAGTKTLSQGNLFCFNSGVAAAGSTPTYIAIGN